MGLGGDDGKNRSLRLVASLHTRGDWGPGREVTLLIRVDMACTRFISSSISHPESQPSSPVLVLLVPNPPTHPPLGRKLFFQASASYVCLTFVVEILLVPPVFSRLCVLRISLFPLDETMNLVAGLRHDHMAYKNVAIMSDSVRIL